MRGWLAVEISAPIQGNNACACYSAQQAVCRPDQAPPWAEQGPCGQGSGFFGAGKLPGLAPERRAGIAPLELTKVLAEPTAGKSCSITASTPALPRWRTTTPVAATSPPAPPAAPGAGCARAATADKYADAPLPAVRELAKPDLTAGPATPSLHWGAPMTFAFEIPRTVGTPPQLGCAPGESLFVLGANVSGKSSLMQYMFGKHRNLFVGIEAPVDQEKVARGALLRATTLAMVVVTC